MRRKVGVSVVVKKKDEASQFSKVTLLLILINQIFVIGG